MKKNIHFCFIYEQYNKYLGLTKFFAHITIFFTLLRNSVRYARRCHFYLETAMVFVVCCAFGVAFNNAAMPTHTNRRAAAARLVGWFTCSLVMNYAILYIYCALTALQHIRSPRYVT